MAAKNTSHAKKRKRGPYLSYLTNFEENIPRTTLLSWSQESPVGNVGSPVGNNKDESCELGNQSDVLFDHAVSDTLYAKIVEEVGENERQEIDEGTSILHEQAERINFASNSGNGAENGEPRDEGCTAIEAEDEYVDFPNLISEEQIDTASDPDELLCLADNEIIFADDYDNDTSWEDLWEDSENSKDAIHEGNQESNTEEKFPLYSGARITLGMSMLLIITFAMRHQLSGTALADLLTLIELHLIAPNCFTRSMSTLHKFFKQLKNPIQFHYYCSFCYEYIGIEKRTCCPNKHCLQDLTKKNCLSYFIVIPLEPQLEALLASKCRILLLYDVFSIPTYYLLGRYFSWLGLGGSINTDSFSDLLSNVQVTGDLTIFTTFGLILLVCPASNHIP